ncbi:MAG: HD domain-containing protein [Nitrospirae bacterium]|nr:HD domain-containing protein [Nitrospirota bacterium]
MTPNSLGSLKRWFSEYVKEFYSSDEADNHHIKLKEEHTYNVCSNAVLIAKSLFFSPEDELTAEAAALFHDIGRFSQYAKFRTFNDGVSINHALRGAEILSESGALAILPEREKEIITEAVKFHNVFKVPELKNREVLPFLKILRDADKLDILRIFVEYYENPEKDEASVITHGLPDTGYSEELLKAFYGKEMISLLNIKSLNDFKLLQLSWIYDLNFRESLLLIKERGYVKRMAAHLPQGNDISNAVAFLLEHIETEIGSRP